MFLTDTAAENIQQTTQIDWQLVLDKVVEWCTTTGIKVIIALILWFISFRIINFVTKRVYKRLMNKKQDATLSKVLCNMARVALKVLVVVSLIAYVGIETASISAVIAASGVGLSLALQGTLSNFAGGMIIIIMRPFKLGDFITSNGQSGTVEDIKLFYTTIVTPDNQVVYIPNSSLANNVIVNISVKDTRRVEVIMSVAYSADVELAKRLIKEVAGRNSMILKDPEPFAEVAEYADSSINIKCRVWCKNADYWNVNWYLLSEIKTEFDANNIEIPFNQLDVNLTTTNE